MQSSQPIDIATCMYDTELDPFTGQEVFVARHLKDRKLQRALLQFFKPENDFEVRQSLLAAGRADRIGSSCDSLIPANPPRTALQARMARSQRDLTEGRYVHTVEAGETPKPARAGVAPAAGYRPHRKSTRKDKHRPR